MKKQNSNDKTVDSTKQVSTKETILAD